VEIKMKIAIVAPSGIPFRIGGAENVWWGLLHHINQYTSHQADLIKLPSPEANFWDLMDNYWRFSQLDLRHFDVVISSKYPAWMIQHPNHICYMFHKIRGLYDLYPPSYPENYFTDRKEISDFQEFMGRNQGIRAALSEFYERLHQLRSSQDYLPPDAFQYPGPLTRQIVHFLDSIGLASSGINKYTSIAHNIVKRKDYFPLGSSVEVIYPPPIQKGFQSCKDDYLFTASRLEYGSKRIQILIEAMRYVKTDIQFKIAGTGEELNGLKQIAGDDKRVSFLGFVKDSELVNLYANSLAVLYIPYDEDYGLITVEAMMSGKPVITATDSGGPNEFVRHGETGFSVPPNPQAIAERIDYLCENRVRAKQMGLAAQQQVQGITWENTVARLLGETVQTPIATVPSNERIQTTHRIQKQNFTHKRQKITVVPPFPVFPPRYGGQFRVFHFYRHLASRFDIELVTLTDANDRAFIEEISPGMRETRIPKSRAYQDAELSIQRELGSLFSLADVVMPKIYYLAQDYIVALKEATQNSDFVIACHPYLLPAIHKVSNKPIWYEAQDVEIELKKTIVPSNPGGSELLELTRQVEEESCQISQLIMVCSQDDAASLNRLYNADPKKIVCVPNGADLEAISYVQYHQRLLKKEKLGFASSFLAVFAGSGHPPNVDAVRCIFDMARHLPDVKFLTLGSVGLGAEPHKAPPNVSAMGFVDDETKSAILGIADVALNPMLSGGGTNLKMLDYLAAGIPVISTPTGSRGLGLEHQQHCIIVDIEQFAEAISRLRDENIATKGVRVENARQYVEQKFDWAVIAKAFINQIETMQIL
jgi:glycosyltransferase involved in cell wall biosynthesis